MRGRLYNLCDDNTRAKSKIVVYDQELSSSYIGKLVSLSSFPMLNFIPKNTKTVL